MTPTSASTLLHTLTVLSDSILGIAVIVCLVVVALLRRKRSAPSKPPRYTSLELTPPRESSISIQATSHFFTVLHRLNRRPHWYSWRSAAPLVCTIVSTREMGIRYIVHVDQRLVSAFQQHLAAYLPAVECHERTTNLNIHENRPTTRRIYGLPRRRVFTDLSVQNPDTFDQLHYVTGAMTHLHPGEQLSLQVTLKPYRQRLPGLVSRRSRIPSSTNISPSFTVTIQTLVHGPNRSARQLQSRTIGTALESMSLLGSQLRHQARWRSYVLSPRIHADEVALLYHFSALPHIENTVHTLTRTLPAPIALKSATPLAITLGQNHYHGEVTPIGLTTAERERHVYIIGGTGNGKTTMLRQAILEDIRRGKGVAVVDPHGDLAESLLSVIPKRRRADVIYFNPDDLSHPIGLNILELRPGLRGDDLLREKDMVTESVISTFRKIFSDNDSNGHRIEYILRNSIQTALTLENATLFTVFQLLNNPSFRHKTIRELKDSDLRDFWHNEFGRAGDYQRVKMAAGITAKIGRFLFSAAAKRVLEQPRSTIDFDDILASGKILICNFSKGLLGEDTASLFGITVLAKLQQAALHRARFSENARRPYYLYVDEFQNFATTSFGQLLSEARKYQLLLTMAEQSTSQQADSRMVQIILANVGTVVCFRTGNPMDEALLLPLFRPYISAGEIMNLPPYQFYIRLAGVRSQEPLSGETMLPERSRKPNVSKSVIAASRKNHAKQYSPEPSVTLAQHSV